MTDTDLPAHIAASQERWRDGRRYLNDHRHALSRWAAEHLHADNRQVGSSGLLVCPGWLATTPIPLENVTLRWCNDAPAAEIDGREPESADVRPLRHDSHRFATYAEALGALARPRLFENRPSYRLVDIAVRDGDAQLVFGTGTYFDVMNTCEPVAHELAESTRETGCGTLALDDLPFRSRIGDPCDLIRRPIVPAISALTVRRTTDEAAFVLHRRDAAKVAHGGGLYQVMPVGVFQPTSAGDWSQSNDFDLWRCIAREYSEEFLGAPEHEGPIDYDDWPFYRALTAARDAGRITAHWLGLGVDPLSFVCDLLVVIVFDSDAFDSLLGGTVGTNAEGQLVASQTGQAVAGIPFTSDATRRLTTDEPMQAAGAALLDLAWLHRSQLRLQQRGQ